MLESRAPQELKKPYQVYLNNLRMIREECRPDTRVFRLESKLKGKGEDENDQSPTS